MKLIRRTFALLMALSLILSMSISVLAADIATSEELEAAFKNKVTDINLTNNIDRAVCDAQDGTSYTIGSQNGSTLSNVTFSGNGNVEVNGDVSGLIAAEDVNVTVNGDVTGVDNLHSNEVAFGGGVGVDARDNATVTVHGDVTGGNASGAEQANGAPGVWASGDSTVIVDGDVTGGNANGTEFANGGAGVDCSELDSGNPTVIVNGNVTGGNAESGEFAAGGVGVGIAGSGSVTVAGNATGGNAASGKESTAAPGALVACSPDAGAGSLTVIGTVKAGDGDESFGDLLVEKFMYDENTPDEREVEIPSITVGACEDIQVVNFTEAEEAKIRESIKIGIDKKESLDSLWGYLLQAIKMSKPGDELTTDAGARKSIPAVVIEAVRKYDVKLTVKWTGGDDLLITKDFTVEVSGYVLFTDLAEMLKK